MRSVIIVFVFCFCSFNNWANLPYSVFFSPLLNNELNADGLKEVQIMNYGEVETIELNGTIVFSQKELKMEYKLNITLHEGLNTIRIPSVNLWKFSNSNLKDLIVNHQGFPAGSYQYCINILTKKLVSEAIYTPVEECFYGAHEPYFLINLIDPMDKSKLSNPWPTLLWFANHSAGYNLTYTLKIAELKNKQSASIAINRNRPVFEEKNLGVNSLVYPSFAKNLESNKTYAWRVEGFYKNIYLGKSETWEFEFLPKEEKEQVPIFIPYLDIKKEISNSIFDVYGELKIKYHLENSLQDTLLVQIFTDKEKKIKEIKKDIKKGDNFLEENLHEKFPLRHGEVYKVVISTYHEKRYEFYFKYFNPDLL